jgi:uncharacterized repeat protein (TIGR03943 family)
MVGLLLVVPVLAVFLVAPPSLGSFAASRSVTIVEPTGQDYPPLATTGVTAVTLLEFNQRALERSGTSLAGATVSMTGFVFSDPGKPLLMARFRIACCAADGQATTVELVGWSGAPPARDEWVDVVGVFAGPASEPGPARLTVQQLSVVPPPADPYE